MRIANFNYGLWKMRLDLSGAPSGAICFWYEKILQIKAPAFRRGEQLEEIISGHDRDEMGENLEPYLVPGDGLSAR